MDPSLSQQALVGRLAKYEAWLNTLNERRSDNRNTRDRIRKLLWPAIVTAPLGFFWGRYWPLAILLAWGSLAIAWFYISTMHDWEYDREAANTETLIRELKAMLPPTSSQE